MFSRKRTKYQYFNDFTSVVFNFQYDAFCIIIHNENIRPTQYFYPFQISSGKIQCSKLGDITTPLRLLEFFFDDVLVYMIVGYTKLYSHREKADISFEITNEKSLSFLSMLLLRWCDKPPDHKMYWETTPYTSV